MTILVFSQGTIDFESYAGKYVIIKTKDGQEYAGRVLELDKQNIGISMEGTGMVYLVLADIQEITEDNKLGSGRNSKDEVYATRYIFTPSYLRLEKGDNYGRIALWGGEMEYAISKSMTVGMMMTWLGSPVGLNSKIAFPVSENVHLGLGVLLGWGGVLFPSGLVALPFGGITIGDTKANFTLSGGYGTSSFLNSLNVTESGRQPAFGISGMKKLPDGATLILESVWIPFIPGTNNLTFTLTPAIRFHRKNTRSLQLGLTLLMIDGEIVPSPIPAISWLFKAF